jgi:hypothetical protein
MRRLANRVDSGEDSWDAIFSGESPFSYLLQGHVKRAITANADMLRDATQSSEEFERYREEGMGGPGARRATAYDDERT